MNLRVELALALIVFATPFWAVSAQESSDDAVEQEWRIRALAVGSGPIELSGAESWNEQWERLEALRRRLATGPKKGLAAEALQDLRRLLEHTAPNVRATALACLQRAEFTAWDSATIEMLARDALPEVRSGLCTAVPASVWSENLGTLSTLTNSEDGEVRRAARNALYGLNLSGARASQVAAAQAELLTSILRSEGPTAYLEEVEHWWRVPRAVGVPLPVGDAANQFAELDESGASLRAARALWLAVRKGLFSAEEAATLAAGWRDRLDPNWNGKHRIQRKILLAAARRPGQLLADALTAAIGRTARLEGLADREGALEDLFLGLLECEDMSWRFRVPGGLGDGDLAHFWSLVDVSRLRIKARVFDSLLAPNRHLVLRVQAADVLVASLAVTGDREALKQLLKLLDDVEPGLQAIAFGALCGVPTSLLHEVQQPLFEAWSRFPRAERLDLLRKLPRDQALTRFRSALLSLGEDARRRRAHPSILELLGQFKGDEECAVRLAAWLEKDVESVSGGGLPGELRLAESAALGGARALHSVAGSKAVPVLHSALRSTLQASMDVAKACAWCLGRTAEGRSALVEFLDPETPTRIRVEAALALGTRGEEEVRPRAIAVLIERFESCDNELRGRILSALSKTGTNTARDFALGLFGKPETSFSQAAQALAVLSVRFERDGSTANFEVLASCTGLAQDGETLRVAIEALGLTRDSRAQELLERLLGLGPKQLGAEREELLIALARVAPDSAVLWRELWRLPLEAAQARLVERFRGKISAAVAFSYRGEIKALEEMAVAGSIPRLEPERLVRLDGQLAFALAEACRAAEDDENAVRLERVALVALAGELPNEKARLTSLRARARLWRSAELAGRDLETAQLAEHLFVDWVAGELSDRDLETLFGVPDADLRRDPLARLAASRVQARARMAVSAGDLVLARRLLAEASQLLGFSAAAAEAQAALEHDLR